MSCATWSETVVPVFTAMWEINSPETFDAPQGWNDSAEQPTVTDSACHGGVDDPPAARNPARLVDGPTGCDLYASFTATSAISQRKPLPRGRGASWRVSRPASACSDRAWRPPSWKSRCQDAPPQAGSWSGVCHLVLVSWPAGGTARVRVGVTLGSAPEQGEGLNPHDFGGPAGSQVYSASPQFDSPSKSPPKNHPCRPAGYLLECQHDSDSAANPCRSDTLRHACAISNHRQLSPQWALNARFRDGRRLCSLVPRAGCRPPVALRCEAS
jgi:hypothetical protein